MGLGSEAHGAANERDEQVILVLGGLRIDVHPVATPLLAVVTQLELGSFDLRVQLFEFRDDVVLVACNREDGVTLAQIATDFGVYEMQA